jgi:phage tail-like protein
MDTNGTRFHLVQGERDWGALLEETRAEGLMYEPAGRSLALEPIVERFKTTARLTALAATDRRGADCDRFGNWHWIDTDRRRILVLSCGAASAECFWSVDDLTGRRCPPAPASDALFRDAATPARAFPDLRLSGLAITERHYLVVGTVDPGGLLVFDLHGGGAPTFTPWPAELRVEPFDITAAAGGGVWILDRGTPLTPARYWRLDPWLRPVATAGTTELHPAVADQFGPVGGKPRQVEALTFATGQSLAASPLDVEAPRAIVGLPDDSILILDSPDAAAFSRVVRVRDGRPTGSVALDPALLSDVLEAPATVLGHDLAFVPDAGSPGVVRGRLYVVGVDGNQAFGFDLEADDEGLVLRFRAEQLLLRRFGGKALECCGGRPWYDLGDRWMALVGHPRRRYVETATLEGVVFDGKLPDCHWRRLILDACIPDDASIGIESRVANERHELAQKAWRQEPPLYLRRGGPEIPFHQPYAHEELDGSGVGAWETLFQSARGRFLELRVTFGGAGRLTPRVRAMRVYYPAFSYLDRYLPAVYREDAVSASFLDRYLANVEGMFTALEGRIAAAEGLFDSRIAPAEYLDWLSGWFGATLELDWDETRRRLLLAYAELLFRWRGTAAGLLAMIRLAIDPCPTEAIFDDLVRGRAPADARYAGATVRLVESFLTRRFSGVSLGDPSAPAQPGIAPEGPWTPAQGAEPLHQRFRSFLATRHAPGRPPADALDALNAAWEASPPFAALPEILLSPVPPAQAQRAADWNAFVTGGLGFAYASVGPDDTAFYRDFLRRRWGRIDALNAGWQLSGTSQWASFDEVALPGESEFPTGGAPLRDWISFVSMAVPIRNAAHQFTVLVPVVPGEGGRALGRRLEQVEAVVRREKPAHTEFQIKPYWALFRAGTARLGLDTALGEGARFTGIELGRTALGEGFLAFGHPWNVTDRAVLGRDAVAEIRP